MSRRPLMQMAWDGERPHPIERSDAARMIRHNRYRRGTRFVTFSDGVTRVGIRGCDVVAVISRVPHAQVVDPVVIPWRCAVKAADGTRQFVNVEGVTRDEAIVRGGEFGTVMECWQMEGVRT